MGLGRNWRKITVAMAGGERILRVGSIKVPLHRDGSALHAFREPWMDTLLPRLLPVERPPSVFDVGANIGQVLLALKQHRPDAHYAGFEPNARNYGYLQRFIQLNDWPDTAAFPVALAEGVDVMALGMRKDSFDVFCSLTPEVHADGFFRHSQQVLVVTGDMMVEALNRPHLDLVKVDVEGAELEVLRGFRGALTEKAPFVVFEVLPAAADAAADDPRVDRAARLTGLLRELGYRFHRINGPDIAPEQPDIDPRAIRSPEDSNFLAVPNGRDPRDQ